MVILADSQSRDEHEPSRPHRATHEAGPPQLLRSIYFFGLGRHPPHHPPRNGWTRSLSVVPTCGTGGPAARLAELSCRAQPSPLRQALKACTSWRRSGAVSPSVFRIAREALACLRRRRRRLRKIAREALACLRRRRRRLRNRGVSSGRPVHGPPSPVAALVAREALAPVARRGLALRPREALGRVGRPRASGRPLGAFSGSPKNPRRTGKVTSEAFEESGALWRLARYATRFALRCSLAAGASRRLLCPATLPPCRCRAVPGGARAGIPAGPAPIAIDLNPVTRHPALRAPARSRSPARSALRSPPRAPLPAPARYRAPPPSATALCPPAPAPAGRSAPPAPVLRGARPARPEHARRSPPRFRGCAHPSKPARASCARLRTPASDNRALWIAPFARSALIP